MKIGILSRRTDGLVMKIKKYLTKKNYEVTIYCYDNLTIDETLLNNDFYILKSKNELFLYAAYYIEALGIPVFPDPSICYSYRNRIQAHTLLKQVDLLCPDIYIGSLAMLQKSLRPEQFPLIKKPIMGSENEGIKMVYSMQDLNPYEPILYLEQYVNGTHYTIHFIEDEIEVYEKEQVSRGIIKIVEATNDIIDLINKWKKYYDGLILFGHFDIVREENTNKVYIVDVGTFPQFANWDQHKDPTQKLCEIFIKQMKNR